MRFQGDLAPNQGWPALLGAKFSFSIWTFKIYKEKRVKGSLFFRPRTFKDFVFQLALDNNTHPPKLPFHIVVNTTQWKPNMVLCVHVYLYHPPWRLLGHPLAALAAGGVSQGSSNRAKPGRSHDRGASLLLKSENLQNAYQKPRFWKKLSPLLQGLNLPRMYKNI